MECINLKERFGKRYRIRWEEPANSRWTDPWYQILLCRRGHIYPHGGNMLGYASDGLQGPTKTRLRALPGVEISQDGDDGFNAIFPVEIFSQVAKLVHPRRRRQMTEEQKAEARSRLEQWHFAPGQPISDQPARGAPEIDLERMQTVLGDI